MMKSKNIIHHDENNLDTTKFVQIFIEKKPYLIIGKEGEHHKNILERTLKDFNLEFNFVGGYFEKEVPNLKGIKYEAVGMGMVYIEKNKMYIFQNSKSHEYDICPNKEHIEKINKLLPQGEEIILQE